MIPGAPAVVPFPADSSIVFGAMLRESLMVIVTAVAAFPFFTLTGKTGAGINEKDLIESNIFSYYRYC
ncbi:MAG: hypothetical protein WDO16_09745 [Bacteroidota bacterium]